MDQPTCSRCVGLPGRQLAGCVQRHVQAALLAAQLQGAHHPLRRDNAQACREAPVLSAPKAFHLAEKHKAGNKKQGAKCRHWPVAEVHSWEQHICQDWQSMLKASGVLGSLTHGQPPHSGLWLADDMSSPAAQPGALGNGPATCHQGFSCPARKPSNCCGCWGDSWLHMISI